MPDFPLYLILEPVSSCNLRCPFCMQVDEKFTSNKDMMGMMELELFKKISQKFYGDKNEKIRNKVIESFNFISEIRNKVAHWNWAQSKTSEGNYYLQNPRKKEEVLKLNKKLLDRYHKCIMEILMFFDGWEERF